MPDSQTTTPHPRLTGLRPDALMAHAMPAAAEQALVPGFEMQMLVGRGGMGSVFLARQLTLDREVAVKVLAAELAGDPLFIGRTAREARTMAKLRHPNIVTVHDFLTLEDGSAALVMEFIAGGSLREKLKQHPQGLPVEEALRLLRQIAAGLGAAHAAGIVHRDMKPENVLLDEDGTARVTDFGLALPLHEPTARLTLTGTTVGTVDYMAPEQWRGEELDARLDIFALGVIAYELLTGQKPRGSFSPPHEVRSGVPPAVSAAVMRALRPDPAERFADVASFAQALEDGPAMKAGMSRVRLALGASAFLAVAAVFWQAPKFFHTPTKSSAPAQTTPDSVPGPWRDAVAGLRRHQDNISGGWAYEQGILTSDAGICIMALEAELPESYDARMTFTRLSGRHSVTLFFRAGATVGSAELDAWEDALAGVQLIGGESLETGHGFRFPIENGRSHELLIEVRPGLVRMSVDGVFRKEFDIAGKTLQPPQPWVWDPAVRPAALAVGSYQSPTRFEKVEWRVVKRMQ